MNLKFIETITFQKAWKEIGLSDNDLFELENILLKNPNTGRIITGSGGARKIRFEALGKGKRGGARVIYVNIIIHESIYFLYAYPKSIKDDLTDNELKNIKKAIQLLKS